MTVRKRVMAPRGLAPALVVVADARCLQDPDYVPRGVGRQALALIRGFPRDTGMKLVALTDPQFPPMANQTAALFDAIAVNPYAAQRIAEGLGTLAAYAALSPMTHDPLYGARFLENASLLRSACVYDFIPLRNPSQYLSSSSADLGYTLRLFWLRKCDRFITISQSTADELAERLHVDHAAIRVCGSPSLDLYAQGYGSKDHVKDRHGILVVGGGDPRKSPETVIRAHARSSALQQANILLTVAGDYGPVKLSEFKALATAEGGNPELVQVPGHIDDADLVALYHGAQVVVSPSVDEGFSLPVVEGMAAGAVVLASDIPAHRELVPNAALLFPVGDAEQLAGLLERVISGDIATSPVIKAQDKVWPRFGAPQVAERFWAFARPSAPGKPAIRRGAKPRIALLGPMPPDRSGVADYTHATCLELGKRAELHVFSNTSEPAPVPGAAAVLPLTELPGVSPRYDRTISVLGNSHFHTPILEHLERFGGASIAHDARMLGFYYICRSPAAAIELASKELGRTVSQTEMERWLSDEGLLETTLLGGIAAASTPMMVHSPVTQALLRDQIGIEPVHLPFCIYHPFDRAMLNPAGRSAARSRLGIERDEIVLATFGFVDRSKAPEDCLWVLDQLHRWGIKASLHFVGENREDEDNPLGWTKIAAKLGLSASVRFFSGYLDAGVYQDYLAAADVAVQLRTYALGALSGAVLDCAAAGLPCVMNQSLFDAMQPPAGYAAHVPDALSPVLIAEQVAALLGRRTRRDTEAARQTFCRERSMDRYAGHLMTALGLPS